MIRAKLWRMVWRGLEKFSDWFIWPIERRSNGRIEWTAYVADWVEDCRIRERRHVIRVRGGPI
jgi:hypothetical protein